MDEELWKELMEITKHSSSGTMRNYGEDNKVITVSWRTMKTTSQQYQDHGNHGIQPKYKKAKTAKNSDETWVNGKGDSLRHTIK